MSRTAATRLAFALNHSLTQRLASRIKIIASPARAPISPALVCRTIAAMVGLANARPKRQSRHRIRIIGGCRLRGASTICRCTNATPHREFSTISISKTILIDVRDKWTNSHGWEMDFNLLHAFTGRTPRSLDHRPLTRRYEGRIAGDKEHLNNEGERMFPSFQSLSSSWKVWFLECLQGVILRNGMRHLEAARRHADLVLKREKQADHIGMRAAAVLARAKGGNDEAL